jgi:predicted RNA methylase
MEDVSQGERNWGQDISFRKDLFLRGMDSNARQLNGKLIPDAGCGSGELFIEMAKNLGLEVVAVDLAFGIEKAYRCNDSPFVHFSTRFCIRIAFSRADCSMCCT